MNRVRRRAERFAAARTGGQQVTQQGERVNPVAPVTGASTKEILKSIREPK